jgi:hypothetical protein
MQTAKRAACRFLNSQSPCWFFAIFLIEFADLVSGNREEWMDILHWRK